MSTSNGTATGNRSDLPNEEIIVQRKWQGRSTLLDMHCTGLEGEGDFVYDFERQEVIFRLNFEDHITCTFTVTFGEPFRMEIGTQIAPYEGEDATFDFSSTSEQIGSFSLTTLDGSGSQVFTNLYTTEFEITQLFHDNWQLDDIECTNSVESSMTAKVNLETRTVSINIGSAKDISCVFMVSHFDSEYIITRTRRIIRNFMARRANLITANEPDLAVRLLDRKLTNDLSGNSFVDANGASFNATFQGSLRGTLDMPNQDAVSEALMPHARALENSFADATKLDAGRFDLWIRGSYSWSEQEDAETQLGLLSIGADYRIHEGLLLGVLTQIDWTKEVDGAEAYEVSGIGWLTGPYVAARLDQNLIFDARVAWGMSENSVSPFDTYEDSFDTQRWLAKAQLTGDFWMGDFHITPHWRIIYFEERQNSYTDSNGLHIDGQIVSLGRVTFGPKISRPYVFQSGATMTPSVALNGVWDFDADDTVDLESGDRLSEENLRARLEVGLLASFPNKVKLSLAGHLDGIYAGDYDTYGFSLKLNATLH